MKFQSPWHQCGCRSIGECLHDNSPTDDEEARTLSKLVTAFSREMKAKLHAKVGVDGGWDSNDWTIDEIKNALLAHIAKGDPVDVANFCAFWWNRLPKEPA